MKVTGIEILKTAIALARKIDLIIEFIMVP
jgi:hypothetical protein